MKTLTFSVLYPGLPDQLITDYVTSIMGQSDPAFDWLMVDDGAPPGQRRLFPPTVRWLDVEAGRSFGKIREIGISFAKEHGYDSIIFSDVDDYYSRNRVARTKECLATADFAFTELQIVDFEKQMLHRNFLRTIEANPRPASITDILDRNYIGLSHSAARVDALDRLDIPETIDVVDWWIFSVLLLRGRRGCFAEDVDTFYRQDAHNYVGVFSPLTDERLRRGLEVKTHHYAELSKYAARFNMARAATLFSEKHQEMTELEAATRDDTFRRRYVETVNKNFRRIYRGWWSEILSLSAWQEYVD